MSRSIGCRILALAVVTATWSTRLVAQEPLVLEYDQATGTARLLRQNGDKAELVAEPVDGKLRLARPARIALRVIHTNTALYTISQTSAVAPEPGVLQANRFLGTLGGYLPDLILAAAGAARGTGPKSMIPEIGDRAPEVVRAAWQAGRRSEGDLYALDQAVLGDRGMHRAATLTLYSLERMRQGAPVNPTINALRDSLGMAGAACEADRVRRLPIADGVVTALSDLVPARGELGRNLRLGQVEIAFFGAVGDSLRRIAVAADSALVHYDNLVDAAYRAERLTLVVANGCDSWEGKEVDVPAGVREVTLSIAPRGDVELARAATQGPTAFAVSLQSPRLVRPALGLSLLVAPGATYPRFGARTPAAGGGTEVYESGTQDLRFSWGLTLGLTWRGLGSSPGGQAPLALWLPEITINPTGNLKAFGIGTAVSWNIVKLGAGILWTRHLVLDRLVSGQSIPNPDFLRTRPTYRSPNIYVSLSVFDLPLFAAK